MMYVNYIRAWTGGEVYSVSARFSIIQRRYSDDCFAFSSFLDTSR